uniref:LIM zinc-binding domain-containing protein n=1 Tax=Arcella intermedia TaxID=1963864 RepID=A0A6B2LM23_9EUKA
MQFLMHQNCELMMRSEEDEGCRMTVCAKCRLPCTGRALYALGKRWHPEHFTCCICEVVLTNTTYFESNGQAFCQAHGQAFCHAQQPLCEYCSLPTSPTDLQILGKYYHRDHILCSTCLRVFSLREWRTVAWEGNLMCYHCFEWLPQEVRQKLLKLNKVSTS